MWVGRSVIRSKCRMAYETAQGVIEGGAAGEQEWPAVSAPEAGTTVSG